MNFIIAQVVGGIGALTNIVGVQLRKKENILLGLISYNVSAIIVYLLLGGYTGAFACLLGSISTIVAYFEAKHNQKPPYTLLMLNLLLSVIFSLLFANNILDYMPIIGSILYTISVMQKKAQPMRLFLISESFLWLIYDILITAYSTAVTDIFIFTSTLIAFIRYFKKEKKDN